MGFYQGRALRTERAPKRERRSLARRALQVFAVLIVLVVVAHLPWDTLRRRLGVLDDVRVEGLHYLDTARVCRIAGIRAGADLIALDLTRVRQILMLEPRVASAEVDRVLPRGLRIRIVEREPVLLVQHGVPWEIDSCGVLLAPLAEGVVADVPLLAGPRFDRFPAGTQILTPEVRRGLAWVRALSAPDLQLSGQVSQVDVSHADSTEVLLMSGTRVLSPSWPPAHADLQALRVVLADLEHRGTRAEQVDLRFHDQVIVRLGKQAGAPRAAWAGPALPRES
jgi:cell division septal protein FtsQ